MLALRQIEQLGHVAGGSLAHPTDATSASHAVAVSMAEGPAARLRLVDALANEPALGQHYLLPTVRGDLLVNLGRHAETQAELVRAASLTRNDRERELLLVRARVAAAAAIS